MERTFLDHPLSMRIGIVKSEIKAIEKHCASCSHWHDGTFTDFCLSCQHCIDWQKKRQELHVYQESKH